eukprot:CAMPEP_0170475258 /NCGR_PEP_ID=MMETSP0123-20130129/16937_1 /TAXON_ID=182087 /ORGANISM="Favella ehrenbergii, Strain Fehren 1" /LENGTH=42 /DNA_ID= /DNA_START= /DNA_END= /DNA_ORIENTATION=
MIFGGYDEQHRDLQDYYLVDGGERKLIDGVGRAKTAMRSVDN